MGPSSSLLKIFLGFGILVAQLATFKAADPADNLTETDDAEFRQGGISQQLMSNYPVMGGMYGNTGGYQFLANSGGGYANMLRNLYRPPSIGLTDKVKHWVKSFMNRRQYVKPYYSPSMQYSADELNGKPVFVGGNSYKAISVPLRQLQKYYKPYYSESTGSNGQFGQSPPRSVPGTAAASSILSYSPSAGGSVGPNTGLYTSESANGGHFSGGSSGLFNSASDGSSALFGNSGASSSSLFSSNNPSNSLFSGSPSSSLFTSGGGSSSIFSPSEGASSALFSATGLSGGNLYGSGGAPSSGLYHSSNAGSGASVFSLDGSNAGIYGSDGSSSPFFGANNGGAGYGSNAAASSLLSSLNAGSNGGAYGDLYASGASPAATIYNPNSGDQGRGYGSTSNKKPSYGASSSALYMSSDQRNSDSYAAKSSQEPVNSFNVDSSRNTQAEPSYSVSFQPAQGKSYSASYDNSGFLPVSFSSEDGYKSDGFRGKSS